MPISLQKILFNFQLSNVKENAKHKDFHKFKEKHIRKITRLNTNFNLLIILLVKSNKI